MQPFAGVSTNGLSAWLDCHFHIWLEIHIFSRPHEVMLALILVFLFCLGVETGIIVPDTWAPCPSQERKEIYSSLAANKAALHRHAPCGLFSSIHGTFRESLHHQYIMLVPHCSALE